MTAFDILVAGEINPDLILSGDVRLVFGQVEQLADSAAMTVGSSGAIFACGAARLGLRVAFIGVCGDDIFGRFMLEAMQARGVDTSAILVGPGLRTGISVILSLGPDRAILTYPGCMGALHAGQIDETVLRRARHLHVSSYFLQPALRPGLPGLFRRARELGLSTSLDTNWDPAEKWDGVPVVLPQTSIFMPNAAEACAIAGVPDASVAAACLALQADTVAVKLGTHGALGAQRGTMKEVPAVPVDVVDTVGAGDSFDAGFVYAFLNNWPLERSLRFGTVCGSLSTQAAGGVDGQPTLEQAMRVMKSP
jgi:sugar/nucleoside kinase (ribokinase family)